jgi:GT2 family glycosyltransferase
MSSGARLAAVVITWNSSRTIGRCLHAINRQAFRDFSVLIIDNHSVDNTLEVVRETGVPIHLITNPRNLGYARAANQGIALTTAPYIAVVNPDVELERGAFGAAAAALDAHSDAGAVAPWLLREADDLSAAVPRGTVDSSGLAVSRGRRVVDRDSGSPVGSRSPGYVFGASGAFAVYRRTALGSVRVGREFFDEDFFAYKEDADISWRLQLAGWRTWFEPSARALHPRGVRARDRRFPDLTAHQNRPLALVRLAYRNHLAMLLKNDTLAAAAPDLPWIAFEELGKFAYYLLRRPRVLGALAGLVRQRSSRTAKRRLALRRARVEPRTVRNQWFRHS